MSLGTQIKLTVLALVAASVVYGQKPPADAKPMIDLARYQRLDAGAKKALIGDGNFGGAYQRPDEDMHAVWEVAVAETRSIIASDWD